MWVLQTVAFLLLVSIVLVESQTREVSASITVDRVSGNDMPSCLQRNTSAATPCRTLSYALSSSSYLDNRDVVLRGNQHMHGTITVSDVEGLTIMADGDTIYCHVPSDNKGKGSGLVFENVRNLSIVRIGLQGCGTLQISTTLRVGRNVQYRSAVYIINSTNIFITETVFTSNTGKGLSLFDVNGVVKISDCSFSGNKVPKSELRTYFGGGGISIELTHCTPGVQECNQSEMHGTKTVFTVYKTVCSTIIEQQMTK